MRTLRIFSGGHEHGAEFVKDDEGFTSLTMDEDETLDITLDWTGWLGTDTISTSTFTGDGVTAASSTNTTKTATTTLSAPGTPYGSVVNQIVTAGGKTKRKTVRVYPVTA